MADETSYTLYLMKDTALIGRVIVNEQGYRFLPNTASHKPSRKFHPNVLKAIPRWADRISTDLLDAAEFKALGGAA